MSYKKFWKTFVLFPLSLFLVLSIFDKIFVCLVIQ